jgi:capsular polysaccharide export protein
LKTAPLGPELEGSVFAHGFSWRKRAFVRAFSGQTDVRFVRSGAQVTPGATLLLWGSAPAPHGLREGVRIVRMEDGFLRSVGLGADLTAPVSWVLDDQGIYYDAHRPSALEVLLQTKLFSPAELARAYALRERLVETGLTKYNLNRRPWQPQRPHASVVLVPGQVERDASIARGSVDIRTNLALLRAVRKARPDAWLVYKPHPDVVAGLRERGVGEATAAHVCDEIVLEGSMHDLLQEVHEVHVLTSLSGFEALLRGKPVVCWGQPFYSGWGLTKDRHPHSRRTRRLSLDELVAATLLLYPRYVDPRTRERCSPEVALEALLEWRSRSPASDAWWRRALRPLIARP